jgi:hypothetical protein
VALNAEDAGEYLLKARIFGFEEVAHLWHVAHTCLFQRRHD